MAHLSDVPKVIRSCGLWGFSKRVYTQVHDDNLTAWAAALAYSWLFAVFPFLIFLLSLLPYLPEKAKDSAKEEIKQFMIHANLPRPAVETIWTNVSSVLDQPKKGLLSIGLLLTVWGASGGMNMTISALDRCYELDRGRPFYRQRPLAVVLTLVAAMLVISLVVLLPVGTIAINWLEKYGTGYVSAPLLWTWKVLRFPLALLMMLSVVNIIYHWGPSIKQRFTYVTPGGLFVVLVWLGLGVVFRFYVEKFGKYNETYGTVGGVAVLLLFFYVDALVLLVGAEINSEIDFEVLKVPRGSRDFRTALAVNGEEGTCSVVTKSPADRVEEEEGKGAETM